MFVMLLMLSGLSFNSQAAIKNATAATANEVRVMEMKQRVEEIRAMDMSKLSTSDRKAVKHELKDMKKELNQMGPVVIISAGALILIIILILLLL